MKKGVLVCEGIGAKKNIGDYIQSLAAAQFFDDIDLFVERERLSEFCGDGEKVLVIMNGWLMHNPDNWPPSDDIESLLLSMHITPRTKERMFSAEGIEFFKKHAPVGCRDLSTLELFRKYKIDSYFSGCLTLTLGEKYRNSKDNSGETLFVDPYFEDVKNSKGKWSLKNILLVTFNLVKHPVKSYRLGRKMKLEKSGLLSFLKLLLRGSAFYQAYSTKFDDDLLFESKFIYHAVPQSQFCSNSEKLQYAEELVRRYAKAKLVVTSRIHCALPCLGIETPVLFITSDNLESKEAIRSTCRFGGLKELFRVMRYSPTKLVEEDSDFIVGKIGKYTVIENKVTYVAMKNDLIRRCNEFIVNKME